MASISQIGERGTELGVVNQLIILSEESVKIQPTKRKNSVLVSAVLGWLGSLNHLLLASYLLSTYESLSTIPPIDKLALPVHFGATVMIASAIVLVYGSALMLTKSSSSGGMLNLSAVVLVSVPAYVYFAFFSEPALLGWLGISGFLLLTPALVSGVAGIYEARSHSG
jgi:hypothetical protein